MAATNKPDDSGGGGSVPHLERTAGEPREKAMIPVVVRRIDQVNDKIRLFRLGIPASAQPVKFLPGQWLDVWCPGIPKAGGFTLTSPPSRALPPPPPAASAQSDDGGSNSISEGYLELAVQKSPDNPPAAWLWQDNAVVVDSELQVRIGGSFVWPPALLSPASSGLMPGADGQQKEQVEGVGSGGLEKVVFVAGGVGVNPLVSMLSHIAESSHSLPPDAEGRYPFEVEFLYSVKDPGVGDGESQGGSRKAEEILFLERIAGIYERGQVKGRLRLFLTGGKEDGPAGEMECRGLGTKIPFEKRRISVEDVASAIAGREGGKGGGLSEQTKSAAVVYICGVPGMTDEFVHELTEGEGGIGMPKERVLCEKWW